MHLWTIQATGFWKSAKERGVLRRDGRRITFRDDYRNPYRWMREQMKKRIPECRGRYPIWLWNEKPDIRMTHWHQGGERVIRLEVEVPDERVLLSGFDIWHYILNLWFLVRTGASAKHSALTGLGGRSRRLRSTQCCSEEGRVAKTALQSLA